MLTRTAIHFPLPRADYHYILPNLIVGGHSNFGVMGRPARSCSNLKRICFAEILPLPGASCRHAAAEAC